MNPKQIGIGLAVLAIVAIAVWQFGGANKTNNAPETAQVQVAQAPAEMNPATDSSVSTDSAAATSEYKDGEYTATGNYKSPAQEEAVEIVVTLADGVVTDAVFTGKATNQVSQKLQGQFAEGFKEEVIGKSIDEINLTVVNGSSLTPKGFMDALEKVKEEAKA